MDEQHLAIVPFTLANPFVDALRLPTRRIPLAGRDFEFRQHWKADGKGGTDLGFGASLYNGSIVLADYIASHPDVVRGKVVVEIGAGLSLVSMVSSISGAVGVIPTDGDATVVEYANENLSLNGFEPCAQRLLWGDAADMAVLLSKIKTFSPASVVILGADIVAAPYEAFYMDLINTLKDLMLPTSATCPVADRFVLSYQPRHSSEKTWFAHMSGWCDVRQAPQEELHADFRDAAPPIHVFEFTPKKGGEVEIIERK